MDWPGFPFQMWNIFPNLHSFECVHHQMTFALIGANQKAVKFGPNFKKCPSIVPGHSHSTDFQCQCRLPSRESTVWSYVFLHLNSNISNNSNLRIGFFVRLFNTQELTSSIDAIAKTMNHWLTVWVRCSPNGWYTHLKQLLVRWMGGMGHTTWGLKGL